MADTMKKHWESLLEILPNSNNVYVYPCVEDVVSSNGFLRKHNGQPTFNRQDVTQYLCKWLKHAEISAESARNWLIEYSVDVLSAISSSKAARIKHSTKSNIKYIYREDVAFICDGKENVFKAKCDLECPLYDEMLQALQKRKEEEQKPKDYEKYVPLSPPPSPGIKETYKSSYENSLKIISEKLKAGQNHRDIVRYLNDNGYKTKTGKNWARGSIGYAVKESLALPATSPISSPLSTQPGSPGSTSAKEIYNSTFDALAKIVWDMYRVGQSHNNIAKYLNHKEYKTKMGKKWSSAAVANLITKIRTKS